MVTETKAKLRAIGSCIAPAAFLVLVGAILLKAPSLTPAGPAQHMRPSQVSLMVPNLEEALRWYEEILGFVRLSVVALEGRPAHALLARDSNVLELIDGGGSLGPARASLAGSTITISRVPLTLGRCRRHRPSRHGWSSSLPPVASSLLTVNVRRPPARP